MSRFDGCDDITTFEVCGEEAGGEGVSSTRCIANSRDELDRHHGSLAIRRTRDGRVRAVLDDRDHRRERGPLEVEHGGLGGVREEDGRTARFDESDVASDPQIIKKPPGRCVQRDRYPGVACARHQVEGRSGRRTCGEAIRRRVQSGEALEPLVGHAAQLGCGAAVGEHGPFAGAVDEDDDRAGASFALDTDVDPIRTQRLGELPADSIVPDPTDESGSGAVPSAQAGDVRSAPSAGASDAGRVVVSVSELALRPHDDVLDKITDNAQDAGGIPTWDLVGERLGPTFVAGGRHLGPTSYRDNRCMRILVTGSAGHLGEALMQQLRADGHTAVGMDIVAGPTTDVVGSVADRAAVGAAVEGADAVIHSATLHKPHISSHSRQDFIDTNVTGTLALLEEAVAAGTSRFIFLSTTAAFGGALRPGPDEPAAWVTEKLVPVPRNVYGVTKVAAEDLCELIFREHGMPVVVLRTSRFFPEDDDDAERRGSFDALNLKVNELLYRRVDLADLVDACSMALERAPEIGFGRYIISATTPFAEADMPAVRSRLPALVEERFPNYADVYAARGWRLPDGIGRVYVNAAARRDLGWEPRFTFGHALERLADGRDPRSDLALAIGAKGYHAEPHDVYTLRPRG